MQGIIITILFMRVITALSYVLLFLFHSAAQKQQRTACAQTGTYPLTGPDVILQSNI